MQNAFDILVAVYVLACLWAVGYGVLLCVRKVIDYFSPHRYIVIHQPVSVRTAYKELNITNVK